MEHRYLEESIIADVPCARELLPIKLWEVEAYAYNRPQHEVEGNGRRSKVTECPSEEEDWKEEAPDVAIRYVDADWMFGTICFRGQTVESPAGALRDLGEW